MWYKPITWKPTKENMVRGRGGYSGGGGYANGRGSSSGGGRGGSYRGSSSSYYNSRSGGSGRSSGSFVSGSSSSHAYNSHSRGNYSSGGYNNYDSKSRDRLSSSRHTERHDEHKRPYRVNWILPNLIQQCVFLINISFGGFQAQGSRDRSPERKRSRHEVGYVHINKFA